jgi:hypothetical protein
VTPPPAGLAVEEDRALAGEYEEVLLRALGVVLAVRLARPQDLDVDAVLRERCGDVLEVDPHAPDRVLGRGGVGDVDDEGVGHGAGP